MHHVIYTFFFFNDTATTEIYTLSYTTLFRSLGMGARQVLVRALGVVHRPPDHRVLAHAGRSEEHTSELQSRLHLVCRLLLEKKKDNTKKISQIQNAAQTASTGIQSSTDRNRA